MKMIKYLVVGCTQTYGTLHGMYETEVIEAKDQKEADEIASEYGEYAIDTWADYDKIRSRAEFECELDPDDEGYEELIDELIEEGLQAEKEYWASKIKDEYQSMDIEELQYELHQVHGLDEFSKIYCKE